MGALGALMCRHRRLLSRSAAGSLPALPHRSTGSTRGGRAPMKRIGMINIKDILRHRHGLGLARAQIADGREREHRNGIACSGSGVRRRGCHGRCRTIWTMTALRARLYPSPAARDERVCVQPDWDAVHPKISRRQAQAPPGAQADPAPRSGWSIATRRWRRGGRRTATAGIAGCLKERHQGSRGREAQMRFDYAPGLLGPGRLLRQDAGRCAPAAANATWRSSSPCWPTPP